MTHRYEVSPKYDAPGYRDGVSNLRFYDFQVTSFARELAVAMPNLDWDSDEMKETPHRWAKMMVELTDRKSHEFDFTVFESDVDEMVIIRDIPFVTLCSHHLVPFIGKCHIAYVPDGLIAGLSKFPRLINFLCKSSWNQESLTRAIGTELEERLHPVGVAVIMTAEHLCMTIRGVQTPGTTTTTSCMRGCFADHSRQARSEFLSLLAAR